MNVKVLDHQPDGALTLVDLAVAGPSSLFRLAYSLFVKIAPLTSQTVTKTVTTLHKDP
jgi:hypothetical protein